jgi:flagellar basal-body rod protein FlgB
LKIITYFYWAAAGCFAHNLARPLLYSTAALACANISDRRFLMGAGSIFDVTTNLLEANMDRRVRSNNLISRNLSNVDTPNYRGTGLEFEKQLATALEGGVLPPTLARTHPGHMPFEEPKAFSNAAPQYKDTGPVHLDIEMSRLAENNIMFNAMVKLLNKKFDKLKNVITEAGR